MSTALQTTDEPQHEWLTWDQTLRVVRLLGVGSMPWRALADWCAAGHIDSKASLVVGGPNVERDVGLEPFLWELASERGFHLNAVDGSVSGQWKAATGDAHNVKFMGLLFRKDQVLELVSHIDPAQVTAALGAEGGWLDGKSKPIDITPEAVVEPIKLPRGRKPDKARWTRFWLAAIELAKEGRLKRGCFNSAGELSEELLLMMGEGPFSPDHVEDEVRQIYRRFVGD